MYVKRFTRLAKRLPKLVTVVWLATREVTWTWTFTRVGDQIKFKQVADVHFQGGGGDESAHTASSVLLRMKG